MHASGLLRTCSNIKLGNVTSRSNFVVRCCAPPLVSEPEWRRRAAEKTQKEIIQAGVKAGSTAESIVAGYAAFQTLLPGALPSLDTMRASDWAHVLQDAELLAAKLVTLKVHYPQLDLRSIVMRNPKVLTLDTDTLEKNAVQVKQLLESAQDLASILYVLPELLDPRVVFSVLVTLRKWYPKEPDPIVVLQRDPEVVRRAQHFDVPLEPVYEDLETGRFVAGSYSREKQQPWQQYIDREIHKRPAGI